MKLISLFYTSSQSGRVFSLCHLNTNSSSLSVDIRRTKSPQPLGQLTHLPRDPRSPQIPPMEATSLVLRPMRLMLPMLTTTSNNNMRRLLLWPLPRNKV